MGAQDPAEARRGVKSPGAVVSHLMWVLRTKLGSSGKTASSLITAEPFLWPPTH